MELEVFNGLRKGNEILGEIQKEMSLEEVEMLMQETAEAIDYQNVSIRNLMILTVFFRKSRKHLPSRFLPLMRRISVTSWRT